jgi:hypothetical protein
MNINPANLHIDLDAEGCPQLGLSIRDMFITDFLKSSCGRFDAEPEEDYGVPDDFARAVGIINLHLKKGQQANETRVFVCIWDQRYNDDLETREERLDFFSEALGYDPHDTEAISKLEVGGTYSPCLGHVIIRRK